MTNETAPQSRGVRAGHALGGRYTLVSRIAKGGMGEVWRVRDQRTGMLVAAKVLRPELRGETISLSRLRLEASNTLRAQHPNIAAVLDSGEDDGQGWIIMELVDGRPLTDYVGDGKRLNSQQLIPILTQTAYALDSSAHAGVVHRDIKPANIMVRPDGVVKLTDFGISFAQGQANLTAVGMVMGTAQYLAPEQALGKDATVLGDLYSLGVIAYEALAGRRPFTGKTAVDIAMAHVKEEVPALPEDVPEPMQQVVFDLLAKDPADRPQTGTALVRLLSRVANELGTTTAPRSLPPPAGSAETAKQPRTPRQESRSTSAPKTPADPVSSLPRRSELRSAQAESDEPVDAPGETQQEANVQPSLPVRGMRAPGSVPDPQGSARPSITKASSPPPPEASGAREPDDDSTAGPQWRPLSSVPRPEPVPTAYRDRDDDSDAGPELEQSSGLSGNVGMWLVGALVILTVILIVIAMIRDRGDAEATLDHSSRAAVSQTEVQTWLTPMPGC